MKRMVNDLNIPLSQTELAVFLDVSKETIETLWDVGLLRRTIACKYRPTGAIAHSSPFDALEYGLASGDLPKRLSRKQAEMWVFCLAEAVEEESYLDGELSQQAKTLYLAAAEEGLTDARQDSCEIASTIVSQYRKLTALISASDVAAIHATEAYEDQLATLD